MEVSKKDRISELPKEIKQHILSFLDAKEAIATSLLSSSWRYQWFNVFNLLDNPRSNFFGLWKKYDISRMWCKNDNSYRSSKSKNELVRYLQFLDDEILSRMKTVLHDDHLTCPNIRLRIESNDDYCPNIASYLYKLKVKDIKLFISLYDKRMISDDLLRFVLTCESLTSLELDDCSLPSTLHCRPLIRLSGLRILSLNRVRIGQSMIDELMANCPAIENLTLLCEGLQYLKLRGLYNLKELTLICNLKRVEIDEAPNFQTLTIRSYEFAQVGTSVIMPPVSSLKEQEGGRVVIHVSYLKELNLKWFDMLVLNDALCMNRLERLTITGIKKTQPLLRLDLCKSLTHLKFDFCDTDDDWFNANLSKLDYLKVLDIRECSELKHIKIPLKHLTTLSIVGCVKLESVDMDCPNLSNFTYEPVIRSVTHLAGRIASVPTCVKLNSLRFGVEHVKLLQLFNKVANSKCLILQDSTIKDVMNLMELRQRSNSLPLYQVRQLKLSLRFDPVLPAEPRLGLIMDAFLRLCPQLEKLQLTCLKASKLSETSLITTGKCLCQIFQPQCNPFIMQTCKVILQFEYKEPTNFNGNNCGCYASHDLSINCWKHSVKKVLIKEKYGFEDDDSIEEFINSVLQ